jgi:hypothetical protein
MNNIILVKFIKDQKQVRNNLKLFVLMTESS